MVAIKDMEMPKDCKKCPLMGTDGNPKNLLSPMMCVAIWATTHEIKHCVGGEILDDCPLVEIEERKEGKWIETAEDYYKAINEKSGGVNENTPYFDDDIACPNCLSKFSVIDNETERFKCCPNCGSENE